MIRILLADDHAVVREGLRRLLEACPDMTVAGEAETVEQVFEALDRLTVDVLILDVSMPGPGAPEAVRRVRMYWPGVRLVVLSMHPEEQYAVSLLRAGASAYLTKSVASGVLYAAIRCAYEDRKYVTFSLAERLAGELAEEEGREPHERLSGREHEILCMLGSGKLIKQIALDLRLSPKTVSTYRARILKKTGLKTTGELIRYVVENRLA